MNAEIVVFAALISAAGAVSCAKTHGPDGALDSAVRDDRGQPAADAAPALDSGADAGIAPDAVALGDAANIDAGPGAESIRGTALEGILIEWPERLDLCNVWLEGRSAADERADQSQVTIARGVRPSLGSGHLGAATLPRTFVRRGTLGDEQFPVDPADIRSNLTRYELTKNEDDTTLSAELEHDLGAAGVLHEGIGVFRRFGDTRPVKVAGFEYEHTFALARPGGDGPIPLAPCGGPPEAEDALELLTATDGARFATVLRQLRTQPTPAGSFPVYLEGAQLMYSDQPYFSNLAWGWFSQTYAAQHHNWQDSSLIDFRRDAGFYHSIYGPFLFGMTPVPTATLELRMNRVDNNGDPGTIEIDTLDLETATIHTETMAVVHTFRRVDRTALLRTASSACATGADVFALGYSDYVFQLLTCPNASPPGFELVGLVPVAFSHDAGQAGLGVNRAAIEAVTVDQRAGYRATVGDSKVTITADNTLYFVTVRDGADVERANFASDRGAIDLQPWSSPVGASNPSKTVSMRLERLWAGQGVGESAIYAPVAFELTFGGRTVDIEAYDRLNYTNTHHNWLDALEAHGEGLTVYWSIRFIDAPRSCFVRVVRDSDGMELLPETELTLD